MTGESIAAGGGRHPGSGASARVERLGSMAGTMAVLAAILTAVLAIVLGVIDGGDPLASLAKEDRFFENLTAINYLAAGLILVYLGLRRRRGRIALIVLGLGIFAVGGEEITWGQRIFEFETPAVIEEFNVQDEISFHNLTGVEENIRAVGMLVSLGFYMVWPWLVQTRDRVAEWCSRVGIPVPSRRPSAVIVLISLAFQIFERTFDYPELFAFEIGETILSYAPALLAAEGLIDHGYDTNRVLA